MASYKVKLRMFKGLAKTKRCERIYQNVPNFQYI